MPHDNYSATYDEARTAVLAYPKEVQADALRALSAFKHYPGPIVAAALSDACGGVNWRGCPKGDMYKDVFVLPDSRHRHIVREKASVDVFIEACGARVKLREAAKARKADQQAQLAEIRNQRAIKAARLRDILNVMRHAQSGQSKVDRDFFFKWAESQIDRGANGG